MFWRKTKIIIIILFSLMQFSCGISMHSLIGREEELKRREDFNAYLALEYLEYSRDLANKYNWRDSDYFSKKALRAANNQEIFAEVPESWDVENSQIEETTLARSKLQLLITPQVKQTLPIQLAHLIMLYDCWISKEDQPWQLSAMSKCKTRFFDLLDEMEKYMANLKPLQEVRAK